MECRRSVSIDAEALTEIHTPDLFLCPISKSLMHDPVVVVETGQVYDNMSILRWFEAGNNTCPLTGVTLSTQKLTRLPRLRSGIDAWAKDHDLRLEPPEMLESQREYRELDNLCRSLSFVTSKGVSVYDPAGVVKLLTRQPSPESYAALVVLREIIQHSDERQFKKISDLIDIDLLKNLLNEDGLKKPAARLLVSLKGSLNMDELASLLVIPDIDLQIELMTRLVEQICQRHSSMDVRRSSRLAMPSLLRRARRLCSVPRFPRRCFSLGR